MLSQNVAPNFKLKLTEVISKGHVWAITLPTIIRHMCKIARVHLNKSSIVCT